MAFVSFGKFVGLDVRECGCACWKWLTLCCVVVKLGEQIVHSWERVEHRFDETFFIGRSEPSGEGVWMPDLRGRGDLG